MTCVTFQVGITFTRDYRLTLSWPWPCPTHLHPLLTLLTTRRGVLAGWALEQHHHCDVVGLYLPQGSKASGDAIMSGASKQ